MGFDIRKLKTNTLGGLIIHFLLGCCLVATLSLLYFFAYLPNATKHSLTITVPNIEGMQLEQVERFLVKKNLRFEINDSSYSSEHPPLTVLKQYPHSGAEVKEGRNIFISVNQVNPPTVPVPNLIDGSVLNAETVLRSNELRVGKTELVPGPFNVVKEMRYQGHVLVPSTRVPKGSAIDLVVMDGESKDF
jgi:beta-lactam-binding protein with PASTA domain